MGGSAVTARVVDPPDFALPASWRLLTSRGPYPYLQAQILIDHKIDLMITKDSGGTHTAAKLDAAADLGVGVVIIARPLRAAAPSDERRRGGGLVRLTLKPLVD